MVSLAWLLLSFGISFSVYANTKNGIDEATITGQVNQAGHDVTINNYLPKEQLNKITEEWTFIDRYLVKDGLAKDPTTGLMWMRCSIGQNWDGSTCVGKAARLNWKQAMEYPKNFEYIGYKDWRMPTKDELKTLIYCGTKETKSYSWGETGCNGDYTTLATKQAVFPNITTYTFWSSLIYAKDSDKAWFINFRIGVSYYFPKNITNAVRLVRDKH